LAEQYLIKTLDKDEAVDSLIRWQAAKNFGTGFVTGLGDLSTLPVAVPSAIAASWVIQARMSAAIAHIYGHDIKDDRVRTFITLTLLGDSAVDILRSVSIKVGQAATKKLIQKIPGEIIKEINKKIGTRFLTKAGEKGIINLNKFVPVVGGVIGGTVDAAACIGVGKVAKKVFREI
jgi:uncharacterized protein (DUF697 family)